MEFATIIKKKCAISQNSQNLIVLIDGNNTCFRVGWANRHLTNNGEPTGVIFGFLKELLAIWERWKDAKIVVAWDTKSQLRMALSKKAIEEGIISEEQGYYKQNRERQKEKDLNEGKVNDIADAIHIQKETLLDILNMTLATQIILEGYEADDIIGTLAVKHAARGDQVKIMSSDKDMYQLLSSNVSIWIPTGNGSMSYEQFVGEYGIEPQQWIDVGAVAGDKGDNIIGVNGIAEKTALKMFAEAEDGLNIKRGTATYKDVISWFELKENKKKKEISLVESKNIVDVAYQLKKIITDINSLDYASYNKSNPKKLKERFDDLGFNSIKDKVGLLTRRAC
jgi:DNA polymerase I